MLSYWHSEPGGELRAKRAESTGHRAESIGLKKRKFEIHILKQLLGGSIEWRDYQ
jgi:hypothetical protein